jgi:hypothetical protein
VPQKWDCYFILVEGAMIRHIVFFSCRSDVHRDKIVEGLSLLTAIPSALRVEIALNSKIDQIENEMDVVVYAEFANRDDLKAYKDHPLYQESIKRVRPLRDKRVAIDFDTDLAISLPLLDLKNLVISEAEPLP